MKPLLLVAALALPIPVAATVAMALNATSTAAQVAQLGHSMTSGAVSIDFSSMDIRLLAECFNPSTQSAVKKTQAAFPERWA